jgi:hypothetical protein
MPKVSYYCFVVTLQLKSLFIGDCGILWLVDLDKSIAIELVVLEGRVSFDDLIITSRIVLATLQVGQVDICQHLPTFHEVR